MDPVLTFEVRRRQGRSIQQRSTKLENSKRSEKKKKRREEKEGKKERKKERKKREKREEVVEVREKKERQNEEFRGAEGLYLVPYRTVPGPVLVAG